MVLTLKVFIELEILSDEVIYQPNIHWFHLHKCEDLLLSSALYQYNKAIQYI